MEARSRSEQKVRTGGGALKGDDIRRAVGERIRDLLLEVGPSHDTLAPWTDALLFTAARAQLVHEVVRPALQQGSTVVCARYFDSTLAYQGFGSGLPVDELRRLQDLATDGLAPDLTVSVNAAAPPFTRFSWPVIFAFIVVVP